MKRHKSPGIDQIPSRIY